MPVRYASWSIFAAMMKSLRDKPSTVWVQSVTRTFPQVTVSSGWWNSRSASSATLVANPRHPESRPR
jgi:hypothetical protein